MRDRLRRRRPRHPFRHLAGAALLAFLAWLGGLIHFTTLIPDRVVDPMTPTDAIVVLTGGGDRVSEGLRLLAAGQAKRLLVSGVYRDSSLADLLQAADAPATLSPEMVRCCISVGYQAGNTTENAREAADWAAATGVRSLRLVTADYHMPRSLLEFRQALPAAVIVPNPVFPEDVKRAQWWLWPRTAGLVVSEYHKYTATLARGWIDDILHWAGMRT